MQYSPKLKQAMEEIKATLNKYDIAGVVVLHNAEKTYPTGDDGSMYTEGFTEYLYKINPSYSAASIDNDRFRVKGKAEHYASREERDKKMSATYNMFDHLAEWTGIMAMNTIDMFTGVKKMVEEIGRDRGDHTGHTQQNN